MSQPFNITLSVPSGNPEKLRVIEKTNRLSQVLVFNRAELAEVIQTRRELAFTGVYLLVNSSGDSLPEIYIGEGESVEGRLRSHDRDPKKEFWEWTIVVVNRDNSLHKGHVQYLEAALIERADQNKRCLLQNDQRPNRPSLPESVLFESDDLLIDIEHIVPLLGLSAFESVSTPASPSPEHQLLLKCKGLQANGYAAGGKLVVLEGSQAVLEEVPSMAKGFSHLRATLIQQGVLLHGDTCLTFTQDYAFDSPSTAGAVIAGRSINGRTEWRTRDGVKLKTLQETNAPELSTD